MNIMGSRKFGLKLLGTHLLMSVIQFFLYLILFSIFQDSKIYQWFMGIVFILIFWLVIYSDASYYGQNDIKRNNYFHYKGFIAGVIATLPGILFYMGSLIYAPIGILLRLWLIPYVQVYVSLASAMPHLTIILALLFPLVSGFSYRDGIRRRNKVLKAIEKKDSQRVELSKRSIK